MERQWLGEAPGRAAIEADSSELQVRGCSFGSASRALPCARRLKDAIVNEDVGVSGVKIPNQFGGQAIVADNEPERKGP